MSAGVEEESSRALETQGMLCTRRKEVTQSVTRVTTDASKSPLTAPRKPAVFSSSQSNRKDVVERSKWAPEPKEETKSPAEDG